MATRQTSERIFNSSPWTDPRSYEADQLAPARVRAARDPQVRRPNLLIVIDLALLAVMLGCVALIVAGVL